MDYSVLPSAGSSCKRIHYHECIVSNASLILAWQNKQQSAFLSEKKQTEEAVVTKLQLPRQPWCSIRIWRSGEDMSNEEVDNQPSPSSILLEGIQIWGQCNSARNAIIRWFESVMTHGENTVTRYIFTGYRKQRITRGHNNSESRNCHYPIPWQQCIRTPLHNPQNSITHLKCGKGEHDGNAA